MSTNYAVILYPSKDSSNNFYFRQYFIEECGRCRSISETEIKEFFPEIQDKNFLKKIQTQYFEFNYISDSKVFYFDSLLNEKISVFYISENGEKISDNLFSLLKTYSLIVQNIRAGNFLSASKLLAQFKICKNCFEFFKNTLRENTFILLSFFWLFSFARDKNEQLLFACNIFFKSPKQNIYDEYLTCSDYLKLLNYSKGFFNSSNFEELKNDMQTCVKNISLNKKIEVVVPVAGTEYTEAKNYLITKMKTLNPKTAKTLFLEQSSLVVNFYREYFESCRFYIMHEPFNPYDVNAAAVIIKLPCGEEKKLGYLKKEFAEIAALVLRKNMIIALPYLIDENKIEIKIKF